MYGFRVETYQPVNKCFLWPKGHERNVHDRFNFVWHGNKQLTAGGGIIVVKLQSTVVVKLQTTPVNVP